MSQKLRNKGDVYAQRNLTSIPAPLDPDSDPEFNGGAFIPPPKAKKGRKSKTADAVSSRKNGRVQRRSDILDGIEHYGVAKSKAPRVRDAEAQNPLSEYFGELDLHSASEDEGEDYDPDPMDEDEEEEADPDEDTHDSPVVTRTMAGFERPAQSAIVQKVADANDDDSATESESDIELPPPLPLKRKSPDSSQPVPPVKRQRTASNDDDSATESETDEDMGVTSPVKTSTQPPPNSRPAAADSETESESESEMFSNPTLEPRPNFPLSKEQSHLPSLVLDQGKHIAVPASINTYLREYQRDGIRFFWNQYKEGRGGLLGDDMGLGKTIQVIAFLAAIMQKHCDRRDLHRRHDHVSKLQDRADWKKRRILPPANATWPTCLIIAPSTVVLNWEREFETWGYFDVGIYTGPHSKRDPVINDFKLGRLDVVVTSLDIARRDIDVLEDLPWSCIFVDEVHNVKNPRSQSALAFNRFDCQHRFGLTGTTIQNNYMEMWTILDWTNPGRLGSQKHWKGYVVKPLTIGHSANATDEEKAKAHDVARILVEKLLPNFFLRRTKDIIKHQLPTKTDQVVFCPLSEIQIAVYKRILLMDAVQNMLHSRDPCFCGSRRLRKDCCGPVEKGDVLKYMSLLIKVSNHLALILPAPNDSEEQTRRNRMITDFAFPNNTAPKHGTAMLGPQYCGKWKALESLLSGWRKDRSNKVLIFTKSVKLLDMLEYHLSTHSYGFVKLDGGTKQEDRMPMIDKFHQDPEIFIFLISTLAGGTGLNLTGANKVVIFDPNWNPAHDLQAMDRAYRFGQKRDVLVFRLLGAGSIEELIYARQLYKQQQMAIGYEASVQTRYFQGVQGDASRQGELFGIHNIFKFHEDELATKMAIEKANLVELDWALANMGTKSKKKSGDGKERLGREADAKASKEDGELRGLGALLFDDDPLELPEEDEIKKSLDAIGVKYSHRNDAILLPSRIEQERAREDKKRRKKARTSAAKKPSKSPEPEWPPKRRHHKPPPSPNSRLKARQRALVEMGFINSPLQYPEFAQDFGHKTRDEQDKILAELDAHAKDSEKW